MLSVCALAGTPKGSPQIVQLPVPFFAGTRYVHQMAGQGMVVNFRTRNLPDDTGLAPASRIHAAPSGAEAISRYAAISSNPKSLPSIIRPRAVRDQGVTSTCVSCSMASAVEGLAPGSPELSPLFHYYFSSKDGRNIRLEDAVWPVKLKGICAQQFHDYLITEPATQIRPSQDAEKDAVKRRVIDKPLRPRSTEGPLRLTAVEIRERLMSRFAVLIGLQLPAGHPQATTGSGSFLTDGEWRDPDLPLKGVRHCVLAVGFSDARLAFRVQDSYGKLKFDAGCWWLAYRVVDSAVQIECLIIKNVNQE